MTPWIELTEADITSQLSAPQAELLISRPNRNQSGDALAAAIGEATALVRSAIRSVPTNTLSENEKAIPPELRLTASVLAMSQLPVRIPGIELSETQDDYIDDAESTLSRVRSGNLPITLPSTPESSPDVRTSLGLEVARKRSPRISGDDLRGL
ncbi:MAG: hypothetical protein AAGA45_01250 [Verrucomicrobiota bacterium]